jgi:serine/threonine-protein kinase
LPVRIDDVLANRYVLKQKIGEGGMGTVYVAHDKELDREVAVKLLASTLVHDAEVVERFEREARMTAKLDHPHIVPVYDVGRHGGRPYIVMKKLEGQTLAALLRKKGGMTQEETLALFRQLASGLDFIHGQGFIHRDIKAGNIFVGSAGQATILDFGILRAARGGEALTRTGMVMGTPHYMAPEQAMGQRNVDHRVDLYALAVVLFECLTGTLPFDADSELRLIQMQAHTPPPELIERAPWVAAPVAEVVKRALAKRPEDRFSSASELVAALQAAYRPTQGPVPLPNPSAPSAYLGPSASPSTSPSWRNQSLPPLAAPSGPPPSTPAPPLPGARGARGTAWAVLLSVLGLAGGLLAWCGPGKTRESPLMRVGRSLTPVPPRPSTPGAARVLSTLMRAAPRW